jgi:L-asparaginase / beta-aspartyl-peptidase
MTTEFVLAIHGGCGVIPPGTMTREAEGALRAGLETSPRAGYLVLMDGGSAIDAVTAAIVALEDDPLFNAGRGAVFTTGAPTQDGSGGVRSSMPWHCGRSGARPPR